MSKKKKKSKSKNAALKKHIFKVQRPLETSHTELTIYVYNEARDVCSEVFVSKQIIDFVFNKDEHKVFMWGTHNKAGIINFEKRAAWQDW